MKLYSLGRSVVIAILTVMGILPSYADVFEIPFHLHTKASSDQTLKAKDFESQEIVNRDLDAYLIIDHVECLGVSLHSGDYGIFIAPTKSETGYLRIYVKRDKSFCLTRAGVIANNYQNLSTETPLVRLSANDSEISIPQPEMAAQRNNPESFSTCLSKKFAGIPLDYVEISVPYIEGMSNCVQITKLRLVYTPGDMELTELEFSVKEHDGYLTEAYEMPELKATNESLLRFVTMASSNEKVATIEDGKVRLTGAGETDISAKIAGVASIVDTKEASYHLTVHKDHESAIDRISSDSAAWTFYDLNGHRLSSKPTEPGVYIARSGKRTVKFVVSKAK